MRLNFISLGDRDGKRGSTRIRVLNIIKALNQKGRQCAFNDACFDGYDAIIFQKTSLTKSVKRLIECARRKNIPIILDLDDYVTELMPKLKYFDLITVSTEYLKKLCDPWHKNVKIVPNMLDVNDVEIAIKNENKHKKVVWYGYSQNSYILDKWKIKGVKKISDKNCDIIYDADKIDEQLQKFDLCVIPQEKNDITLVKTHCRMLKALYLGLPCLVSDMPVYIELAKELDFPQDFIVSNPEKWNQKIEDFMNGKLKFEFDFAKAREKILQKYGAEVIADIFENIMKEFIKQKHKPLAVLDYENELMPISVVLNANNQEKAIKSVKSLLMQTWFDFEIVIFGADVPEELFEYAAKDKRIRINKNPRGKYVYFLNGGDVINENCLKRMYAAAIMSDADITMMQGFVKNGEKKIIIPSEKCAVKIADMKSVLEFLDYPLVFGTCLYKREFLINKEIWNPKISQFPDDDFAYLVWKKCGSFFAIPEILLKKGDDDFLNATASKLLKNYAKVMPEQPIEKRNTVLVIVHDLSEILPALVTLNSIIEKYMGKLTISVFFMFAVQLEVKEEFEKLSNENISVQPEEKINYKGPKNNLNILSDILLQWQGNNCVLYLSNSCLAMSDFAEIFSIKEDKIICSKINEKALSLDTNVVLFDTGLLKKQFNEFPLKKKITNDMWYEFMANYNEEMPECYNWYAEDYKGVSSSMLPKIKFICYKTIKPWQNLLIPFGFLWWRYARKNIFYEQLLKGVFLANSYSDKVSRIEAIKFIHKNSDANYLLMKEYIKEAFLYLFTFGAVAKQHKNNLFYISQKLLTRSIK